MKKGLLVLALLLLCISVPVVSFAVERSPLLMAGAYEYLPVPTISSAVKRSPLRGGADKMFNVGVGVFAGMTAIKADVTFSSARTNINIQNLYWRIGMALTDSKNLIPSQNWRKAAPLFLEGIYYLTDAAYVGAGLNIPLMASDACTGKLGGQIFIGSNFSAGIIGKAYVEAGYSTLNLANERSFAGLQCIIGLRYALK